MLAELPTSKSNVDGITNAKLLDFLSGRNSTLGYVGCNSEGSFGVITDESRDEKLSEPIPER